MDDKTKDTGAKRHRWLERCPEMGAEPVPVSRVTDPDYFEKEREKIFKRSWLHMGRASDIPNKGDWFVQDIVVANTSLIVVRGQDNVIRAFHNICRHRGSKLAFENKGTSSGMLSCRFHGWTYDTTGELRYVPQEENYYEPLCGKQNLFAVACDVWEGFIFINLDPEPKETLLEFLGPAADRFEGYPFDKNPTELIYRGDIKANWKLVMDAQAEAIHAAFVHTKPWPGLFSGGKTPFANYLDISFYGKHSSYTLAGGTKYTPTEVEALALSMGPSVSASGDDAIQSCKKLNPTNDPNWSFDSLVLFPNFIIYCFGGVYHTHQFWPLDHRTTNWELRMHLPEAKNASELFSQEHAKIFLRDPFLEDGIINEEMQKAMESGVMSHVYMQDDEALVRHCYWVAHNAVMAED
ncbi:MAG: aromatic ring-hydroxylating oxygenase subunit alpha [Gammaproteobacteria bacterium]